MQKFNQILLSTLLTAAMLTPTAVFAEEAAPAEEPAPANTEYEYELDAEGNAKLAKFNGIDTFTGDLTIPSEIDGHPVNFVKAGCFMEAKGIKSVTIPATITDMGDDVFMGCTALERFVVEAGNPYYSIQDDGVLYADDNKFLVAYPAAKADTTYSIPAGVEEIAPGAFGFSFNLKEIIVPEGVQFIDGWAFAYSGIEKASIAGTVYQIDDYAFAYCDSLHEVDLGHGIEKIQPAAFANDRALQQITLPDSLTLIGQYAFCGTSLPCVTIPDSLETIDFCAFGYDASFNAISDFTIYGEPGTMAQEYSTASDDENEYQNHFNFVAVKDASVPYELGMGELYEEGGDSATDAPASEIGADTEETLNEVEEAEREAAMTEKIGAGLSGNKRMQIILGVGGGVLIALAVVLITVFTSRAKKNRQKEQNDAK